MRQEFYGSDGDSLDVRMQDEMDMEFGILHKPSILDRLSVAVETIPKWNWYVLGVADGVLIYALVNWLIK